MPVIVVNDPTESIWLNNPTLSIIKEFKDLKLKLGPDQSSMVITAIHLIWDPKSDMRSSMSEEEVLDEVTANYIDIKGFEWKDYEHVKDAYFKKCLSRIDKMFSRFENDLTDLDRVLGNMTLTEENAKAKTDLLKQYKQLFEDYLELKKKVDIEKQSSKVHGNYRESLIEKLSA